MPRSKVWIFGSGNGGTYADNSRALFEYVNTHAPEIKAIWLTQKPEIVANLRANGQHAHLFYSWAGLRYALTSKVVVIANSFLDVGLPSYAWLPRRKRIVQLWHGTPLKVLENKTWSAKQRLLITTFLTYIGRDCDMVISATERNIPAYVRNFRIKANNIKITGQPRNDWLFNKTVNKTEPKKIWYIPTFRDYDEHYDFFTPNGFDARKMNDLLRANNAELHLKLHHVDKQKFGRYLESFKDLPNIHVSDPPNLYEELGQATALLTDYSSVYFDFLLVDQPIIFTAFDYQKYKKDRNFYYEYDDVTPGPKAANWQEVMQHLQAIFTGQDEYKRQRQKVNDMFNTFKDNRSGERTLKAIEQSL